MPRFSLILLLTFHFFTPSTQAGGKWTGGDYGPVISTHMAADGRVLGEMKSLPAKDLGNFVFRGRVISLNKDKTMNVCFDTDHMRIAAAWEGDYLDWKGAFKNMGPAVKGTIHFQTKIGPGWSHDGKWDDPRQPAEGPLPKEWAKYRGLYMHGDKVVLSYTVGDCPVLEMPGAAGQGKVSAFVRNFTLGPSAKPLGILVCEEPGASGHIGKSSSGDLAVLQVDNGRIVAGVAGAPTDSRWEVVNGRIHLLLPALKQETSLKVFVARIGKGDETTFAALVTGKPEDLHRFTKGGPAHWTTILESRGELGKDDDAYVVDNIPPPKENPWNAWFRFGAIDFFEDGRAALSTWDGDVWIVSGIDKNLQSLRWKRFATGLQQPLGLKIVKGIIHTAGRDQITRLHDLNNDGEADFYENFNNDAGLTPQRHEFVMDLETDAAGNFYYCRSGHYLPSLRGENCCVMRLPPDGSKLEVVARGLREPNGLGISPDGLITVGDNEGDGIPQTPIYPVKKGDFFGYKIALRPGELPRMPEWAKPIVWLPKTVDRSAGSQIWVTSDKWGPLQGKMLHTSYGHCRLFHVMIDRTGKELQGAAVQFPLVFSSGIMRGRFHPKDGQLYLCGMRGWDTTAAIDTQFCRVRYTGKPLYLPTEFRVTKKGVQITFATPLDRKSATDDQNWALEWFDVGYRKDVKTKPRDDVFLEGIELSRDGKTVTLEFEKMMPATNLNIEYRLQAAVGKQVNGMIYGTINAVP
jgi:hypothetical protein